MSKATHRIMLSFSVLATGVVIACEGNRPAIEAVDSAPPIAMPRLDSSRLVVDPSGLWRVWVKGLNPLAPESTLAKTAGLVYWKISLADGGFELWEYQPHDDESLAFAGPFTESSFHKVPITAVEIGEHSISFQVPGDASSVEHYQLDRLENDVVRGGYRMVAPRHDELDSGPEYDGSLLLERES